MRRLSLAHLARIPDPAGPPLHPRGLSVGIVHLGLGAFHRGHQAVYTQTAMAASGEYDWAICGVAQRSRRLLDALEPQDGLYTVIERGPDPSFRVLSPLRSMLFAAEQQAQLLDLMAAPSTRVVTLTVTEKGYRHDAVTGRLKTDDPEIVADVEGRAPATVVGQLVRGLQRRQRYTGDPLNVICCDNLSNNGATLRGLVADFCALLPPVERAPLMSWIAESVAFPSTMVDRIVPASTPADLEEAAQFLQLEDRAAVVAEPFSQWVIEDVFAATRPAWETAGAIVTSDVAPYEAMKLRLVNGTHSALAYLGALAGYEYVAEFFEVEGVAAYLQRQMHDEVAADLRPPTGVDLVAYQHQLMQRFANRGLRYRTAQIAIDGSKKLPPRLVAIIADRRAAGAEPRLSVLAVAAWMRYISARRDDAGQSIEVEDPLAERFAAELADAAENPAAIVETLLGFTEIFGNLRDDAGLRQLLTEALVALTRSGVVACVREVVGLTEPGIRRAEATFDVE